MARKRAARSGANKPTTESGVLVNLATAEGDISRAQYSNHAELYATDNDITIDLFWVAKRPGRNKDGAEGVGKLIERVVVPFPMAKGLATALANLVNTKESKWGYSVRMSRTAAPDDTIQIWDQDGSLNPQIREDTTSTPED